MEKDKELLERQQQQRRLATPRVNAYFFRKDVRESSYASSYRSSPSHAFICKDPVVHNALYTGNLEAVRQLLSKEAPVNVVIQPQGGDMVWAKENGKWVKFLWHGGEKGCFIGMLAFGLYYVFCPSGL